MFKNDNSMDFLRTEEYRKAPLLGNWKAFYLVSIGFFMAELLLFSYLTLTY